MEELILIGICIIFIILPLVVKKKGNFFTGSENKNLITTTLSITASWIGVTSMLVLSSWIFELGQAAIWYLISPGIGLILLGFFGIKKVRRFKGVTIGEYFKEKSIRITVIILISLIYTFVLGAQIVGFAQVSQGFNISYTFGLVISGIVIIVYVGAGGFNAVSTTDIIQAILIFITLIGLFFVIPIQSSAINISEALNPFTLKNPYGILFLVLGLMMFVAQENHQRIRAAKSDYIASTATIISGLIIIIYTISILSLTLSIGNNGDVPIIHAVGNLDLKYKVIFSIGLLGAALSTADTALNISSYSIHSLFREKDNKLRLFIIIILVTVLSSLLAHFIPSIKNIILISINMYVGILFPLMVLKFINFDSRFNIVVFISSIIGFVVGLVLKPEYSGMISMLVGVTAIIVLYITMRIKTNGN